MEFPLPAWDNGDEAVSFSATTHCNALEIRMFDDGTAAEVEETKFDSDDAAVLLWFSRPRKTSRPHIDSSPSRDSIKTPTSHAGCLRLLYNLCDLDDGNRYARSRLPFTSSLFRELEDQMGTSGHFEQSLSLELTHSLGFESKDDLSNTRKCYIFRIGLHATGYYNLALSYDYKTNTTYGIMLAETIQDQFPSIIYPLKISPNLALHPLSLVSGLLDLVIDSGVDKLTLAERSLNYLEEMMGQHHYANRPVGNPLEIDFVRSTRLLNSTSTMLGITSMRLAGLLVVMDMILEANKLFAPEGPYGQQATGISSAYRTVGWQLARTSNICRNMILSTEREQKRTGTQLSVMYNFMSRKDALVNISLATASKQIAAASKRDSSAMKTIAVLTMIFLPGTFTAAFFAMPLFNWDAPPGKSVRKDRFNYYWITTIPLTIMVLVIWTLFLLLPWHKWVSQWRGSEIEQDLPPPSGNKLENSSSLESRTTIENDMPRFNENHMLMEQCVGRQLSRLTSKGSGGSLLPPPGGRPRNSRPIKPVIKLANSDQNFHELGMLPQTAIDVTPGNPDLSKPMFHQMSQSAAKHLGPSMENEFDNNERNPESTRLSTIIPPQHNPISDLSVVSLERSRSRVQRPRMAQRTFRKIIDPSLYDPIATSMPRKNIGVFPAGKKTETQKAELPINPNLYKSGSQDTKESDILLKHLDLKQSSPDFAAYDKTLYRGSKWEGIENLGRRQKLRKMARVHLHSHRTVEKLATETSNAEDNSVPNRKLGSSQFKVPHYSIIRLQSRAQEPIVKLAISTDDAIRTSKLGPETMPTMKEIVPQ